MKNHVFVAVACLFLAACSGGGETKEAKLETIPLGVAFENQTELKTSDCFKKIRYVALETTDSCLVGQGAYATILNDWIVVTSGRDRCQLFDKKTGRFIRSVGHVGEDPEGYSNVHGGWQNPYTGQLSVHGWKNEIVVYGADGRFDHIWTPSVSADEFPAMGVFDYLDADLIAGYYSATDSLPARIALFRGDEIVRVESLPVGQEGDKAITPDDIVSISVLKDGGDGLAFIKYKDGRSAIYPLGNSCFWHAGKDLYFRQSYNDTIYRVSAAKELQPVRVLDLGVYSWSYNERFEDKKDAIYPTKFMENEDVILFRFMTNVYNDKQKTYNALYRKADGAVKVSPLDDKITDDTNGFLPLQPVSVSASGEFAAILPSEEVVSWFEDNTGETDIPAEVAALKKVGEEDNPVVVIME